LAFLAEATEIVEQRPDFVARPVSLPQGLPTRVSEDETEIRIGETAGGRRDQGHSARDTSTLFS
jgi:hypothetical protein